MNWQTIKNLTYVQIGAFLALLMVVFLPNFGIKKYGPSPVVPALLLFGLGVWLLWRERATLLADRAIRRLATVFLLLLVPMLLSIPGSFNMQATVGLAVSVALFFVMGVALVRVLRGDDVRQWLGLWITVVLALWVADGLVQYLFGQDLVGIPTGPQRRVTGLFAENIHLPILLALLLPIAIAFLQRQWALLALLIFILGSAVAVLSGARTILVWLAIIAAGVYWRLPRRSWKFPLLLGVLAAAVLAVALTPAMQERFAQLKNVETVNFDTANRFLTGRLFIWDTALNMVERRPLTGVGAGAFSSAYASFSTRPDDVFASGMLSPHHAHSAYIGLAAECGIPGVLGLLAILVLGIRWYREAPPARRDQAWPYALGLLVYAFPLNTQPPLFATMNWLFPILVLLLSAMLAALDGAASGENPSEQV